MKYFQNLILLGIIFPTIILSQSIEIPHKMMNQDTTLNIPIFIYDVSNLESIQLKIEYDENIVNAEEIFENPLGILDDGYTFTYNLIEPGIINLAIVSNLATVFSGNGMVAQIKFKSIGNLGEYSSLTFLDAQINSDWQIPAIDGSIEIILDNLTITGQDNSEIGADHVITLGMCDGCNDGWKFGEDEYDYPNPVSGEYTNINFYHLDWFGQTDINGNSNELEYEFSSDFRNQHSFRELTSWGIKGSTGGGLSSDIDINLSWDLGKLMSNSDNFNMFIYVGEVNYNMQEMSAISLSQSDLIGDNNETNIWIKMGECADTGETLTYYRDIDGDGLGSSVEGTFCLGMQPNGWVDNNDDQLIDCFSNDLDCGGICDGTLIDDCFGICGGTGIEDNCGNCDYDQSNDCVQDCNNVWGGAAYLDNCGHCDNNSSNDCIQDCNGDWGGMAYLDNCLNCIHTVSDECVQDCSGVWGGSLSNDECGICGGNENDGDTNGDGELCDIICSEGQSFDCNGICNGGSVEDECGVCDNDSSNDCVQDCNNVWGGAAYLDNCGHCDNNSSNDCIQDCNGDWGGTAVLDNCGICDNDLSNDCQKDCNNEWGGTAVLDNCGICDNDLSNDCEFDCNNEWGGGASIDNCQICSGGSTGLVPCEQDCNGDWGGYAFIDECGICDSDNNNNNQCFDCNEEPNGGAIIDNCLDCILEGETSTCIQGCDGNWNNYGLEIKYDECGVCGGNNSTCTDCYGDVNGEAQIDACGDCSGGNSGVNLCPTDCLDVANGNAIEDNCGICDSDPSNDCILDCNGNWGGEAVIDDNCGTCIGGATGLEPCSLDCIGVWGGNYIEDLCGICDADSENDNQCVDCNGTVDGLAYLDNCGNCVEDSSDLSYECEPDCDGIYGGNHPPNFSCENGSIACSLNECFLANDDLLLPKKIDISRIYPNPFNPQATIDFEVSEPTMVQLNIYNLNGQKVDVLKNAFTLPGYYSVNWNGTNHPSGIYFVILQSSNSIVKQKMMLIK
ncbi:MAG: T9SS type A sorting domain-containing protein [Candidatus Marinimicrobia bacterium]|nr:T9SS type A sorting domain-containing protein [Candidatus Neomarinimicrobiota bacterium]